MTVWQSMESAPKGEPGPYAQGPDILTVEIGDGWKTYAVACWYWGLDPPRGCWMRNKREFEPTKWAPIPELEETP